MAGLVLTTIDNRIAYITLNRVDKRNALNTEMVSAIKKVFTDAERNENVKVIVLKANGEAFCAGADLAYLEKLQSNSYAENLEDSHHLKELFALIYNLKKVVIAQVEGHAIAGGCGLASACDFVFSIPEAKFGYTEVNIGFVPAIVSLFLIRKIGEGKARELLLSGTLISAQRAMDIGMINYVYPKETIMEKVNIFALDLIETKSAKSLELTKQLISEVQNLSLEEGLNKAAEMNATARNTEDCKKGIAAFLNKTKHSW